MMHPIFAELLAHQQQACGMKPSEPPVAPEEVRRLLSNHPAQPIGSADAI